MQRIATEENMRKERLESNFTESLSYQFGRRSVDQRHDAWTYYVEEVHPQLPIHAVSDQALSLEVQAASYLPILLIVPNGSSRASSLPLGTVVAMKRHNGAHRN